LNAVKAMVSALDDTKSHSGGHAGSGAGDEAGELRIYRETFMRFVQNCYWEGIEEGLIPRTSRVARVLLFSANDALQEPGKRLDDWKVVERMKADFQCCSCINSCVANVWPLNQSEWLQSVFPADVTVEMWNVYLTLCFIDAHKTAREEVPKYFSDGNVLSQYVQEQVARESCVQTEEAAKFMESLSPESVVHGKNRMLAGKLLHVQLEKVTGLAKKGILDDKGAAHIMHHLQAEHRKLAGYTMLLPSSSPTSKRFF